MQQQQGEKMNTTQTKYVAVSPPRTGTMSMSQMMSTLGFSVSHAPGPDYKTFMDRVDFVSDTPMFTRDAINYCLSLDIDVKFIYMVKDVDQWVTSMNKVGLSDAYARMDEQFKNGDELSRHNVCDYEALADLIGTGNSFTDGNARVGFLNHQQWVMDNIPPDKLLVYSFDEDWATLCSFVGKDIPEVETPHLNVNTMFDKIV